LFNFLKKREKASSRAKKRARIALLTRIARMRKEKGRFLLLEGRKRAKKYGKATDFDVEL
jgi:hypothetical protein